MGREAARNAFFSGVDFHNSKCDESNTTTLSESGCNSDCILFRRVSHKLGPGSSKFQPRSAMPSMLPVTVTLATLQQPHYFPLSAATDLIVPKASFSWPWIFAVEFATVKWHPFHKLKARSEVSIEAGTISPEIRVVQWPIEGPYLCRLSVACTWYRLRAQQPLHRGLFCCMRMLLRPLPRWQV
jgi:hypothetical protein